MPHDGEVSDGDKVLSDGNGVVEVHHHVPPPSRHKDSLTRALEYLYLQEERRRD